MLDKKYLIDGEWYYSLSKKLDYMLKDIRIRRNKMKSLDCNKSQRVWI